MPSIHPPLNPNPPFPFPTQPTPILMLPAQSLSISNFGFSPNSSRQCHVISFLLPPVRCCHFQFRWCPVPVMNVNGARQGQIGFLPCLKFREQEPEKKKRETRRKRIDLLRAADRRAPGRVLSLERCEIWRGGLVAELGS